MYGRCARVHRQHPVDPGAKACSQLPKSPLGGADRFFTDWPARVRAVRDDSGIDEPRGGRCHKDEADGDSHQSPARVAGLGGSGEAGAGLGLGPEHYGGGRASQGLTRVAEALQTLPHSPGTDKVRSPDATP